MDPAELERAVDAARAVAMSVDLAVDDAVVLSDSTKAAVRLLPCDVVARIARVGEEVAAFEVDLAQRLVAAGAPVGPLDPRVPPVVHERDGFAMTLWTHLAPATPAVSPAEVAAALVQLHRAMRILDVDTPRFTDRVAEAVAIVGERTLSRSLAADDRDLLLSTMREAEAAVLDRGAPEQLLHGEPHPGNVIATAEGLLFIDLETCCRGPIEYDLAHVPSEVAEHYPDVDPRLLADCGRLALAVVAGWRCDPTDQLPNGVAFLDALLGALRAGPPWPTLDAVYAPFA